MGTVSAIEWTDHTFNPWLGCTPVSPGCKHCYAEAFGKRIGIEWGPHAKRRFIGESRWALPLQWNRAAASAGDRRRVFCASFADVFEDRADLVAPRARLFRLIEATPALDWLLLTKRPENVIELSRECGVVRPWPRNIWLGVTIEDEARSCQRLPLVAAARDAARPVVTFVSYEPALELVDFRPWFEIIDWIIVGGESGSNARPFDPAWARATIATARDFGVAPFVKQLGKEPRGDLVQLRSNKGHVKNGDMAMWPGDLRVREWPRVGGPFTISEGAPS